MCGILHSIPPLSNAQIVDSLSYVSVTMALASSSLTILVLLDAYLIRA